jgi:transketolase
VQGTTRGPRPVEELRRIALRLSRQIIDITTEAGSGHPSSSLSAIDILTALYFGVMRHDPARPDWPDRDRFILSKGHAAPGLYVVLAEAGYLDPALLHTLRQTGSPVEGHPNARALDGVEASTGSLGQGLSIGLGHALAARVDGRDYNVYVMLGDGEVNEGQVWEAAMAAAKYRVGNLIAILDHNGYQQTGSVVEVMPSLAPITSKWRAFGWDTVEIDGHDMKAVLATLREAAAGRDRPLLILAHTLKGAGLRPFEGDVVNRKHGVALTEEERQVALQELDRRQEALAAAGGGC